jgi:high-affinity Fe2+/Pb2+ permease
MSTTDAIMLVERAMSKTDAILLVWFAVGIGTVMGLAAALVVVWQIRSERRRRDTWPR